MGDLLIGGGEEHDVRQVRVSSSCLNTTHTETFSREEKNPRLNHSLPPPITSYQSMQSEIKWPSKSDWTTIVKEGILLCFSSILKVSLCDNAVYFSHTVTTISIICLLWHCCMLCLLCRDELCAEALIKTGVDQKAECTDCFWDQSKVLILIHICRVWLAHRQN